MIRLSTLLLLIFTACGGDSVEVKDVAEGDTDTDADTDTDTDTDADTDTTDTDTDTTDTDTDVPGVPRIFDAYHVLVVPTENGVSFYANDGSVVHEYTWAAMVGACPGCTGEGASPDGDGLLVSWAGLAQNQGIARINSAGVVEFKVTGMAFPHDAVRDPADDSIIVPEAFADALTWYPGDGSSDQPTREISERENTPGYNQRLPNGMDRLDYNGRTYILVSNRASGGPGGLGLVTLWDITDPAVIPTKIWQFPKTGSLDTPHGPVIRQLDGVWYLLYAHSYGGPNGNGAVGVATMADPTVQPEYVADLVPELPVAQFDFLRGVELTDDGFLWMTDSGPEASNLDQGRIITAPFPAGLVATGKIGSTVNGEQDFIGMPGGTLVVDDLPNPFEGWLWVPTIAF